MTCGSGTHMSAHFPLFSHLSISSLPPISLFEPLLACDPFVLGGGRRPALRYAEIAAWLAVLFYLLADTAAVYLYPSLEGLACLLGLPPAIAGATLLSLGNCAPDALSALSSFVAGGGRGAATVRLNGNVCVRRRARRCRPPHRRPWGHRRSRQLLP